MKDLFSNDPVFKGAKRDRFGRFATAEKAMYDKVMRERSWMEFQVEKYRRMAESSTGAFITLSRVIEKQKRIIADLRKELAELKRKKKC
ncbi:MAG: hypothetical protein IJ640_09460 [Prevotella sp.]|nr:hypothetical protein [Prevotella sp.]